MDERAFWKLIALIDGDAIAEDEYAAVEPVILALAKFDTSGRAGFEEQLAQQLYALDGRRYADEAGESGDSDDGFLYARCFVVAQGEAHYRQVVTDPSRMPKSANQWCEALLTVASTAHERATGVPIEFDSSVSYETRSNREQWE
jgi:hypothetical protein